MDDFVSLEGNGKVWKSKTWTGTIAGKINGKTVKRKERDRKDSNGKGRTTREGEG